MDPELIIGRRVLLTEGLGKYAGLRGEIIHREWTAGPSVYRRESTQGKPGLERLALVVQLEGPPAGLEPLIHCYADQVTLDEV